jgi:hypothetical protein
MRYPLHLVLPALAARLYLQYRYAHSRGWGYMEITVWAEVVAFFPLALWHRSPVRVRAVKIWLMTSRLRVSERDAVWRLGETSWWRILFRPGLKGQVKRILSAG